MEYLIKIPILSLSSILVLFILSKIMGNKEISQLSMFDYTIGITIGSIAAEMATSLENNFMEPLIAMIVYALIAVLISYLSAKFLPIRRIIEGKSVILYDNGKIFKGNFKKMNLDLSEFLMQCRVNGYFNLADLQTVILEANGKMSFLPKSSKRPANPEDLSIRPQQENIVINLILDGKILKENLKFINRDENWLIKEIKKQGFLHLDQIFLATYDNNNNLSIYKKINNKNLSDPFE